VIRLALLDRMVFRPCREPIATQGVEQEVLKVPGGTAELWIREIGAAGPYVEKNAVSAEVAKPIVVLKFPGTSGRAENAGPQPLSLWPSRRGVVIAVNPPGYGATRGRARLADAAPLVDAVAARIARDWPDATVIVSGNSLGALRALDFAAGHHAAGVVLRNPPLLEPLIAADARRKRASAIGDWLIKSLPESWQGERRAAAMNAPVLVIQSLADRIVPPSIQDRLVARLGGPVRVLRVPGADHEDPVPDWLLEQAEQEARSASNRSS